MELQQQKNGSTTKAPEAKPVSYEVTPPIDVLEGADAIHVLVDLPGVAPEALSLDIEKDQLTLRAKRPTSPLDAPLTYVRTFVVPRDVDRDAIAAKLEAGTLTLTLPRAASAKPRQIPVKAS